MARRVVTLPDDRDMEQTPFGPLTPPSRGPLEIHDVAKLIADRVPQLLPAMWAVTNEQVALTAQVVADAGTHESVRLIFNLAVNDFRDLLNDLHEGSGRSAMRTARSLIEHAINMHTVIANLGNAQQYIEHLDQGPALALDLEVGVTRLGGAEKRAYLRALRKIGVPASRKFEAAVAERGPWFRRRWIQSSISDRADTHGLQDLYRLYKLASLVTHGSAGGSLGMIRDQGDLRTFRTGPALELAPVAMWAGVAAYRQLLAGLAEVRHDIGLRAYIAGLDDLDALWIDYFHALREIDAQLWPTAPVRPPKAVLAFTRTKKRRWYLHLPSHEILLRATDPVLPDWLEEQIESAIERLIRTHPEQFTATQRWLTLTFEAQVSVTPDGTGHWIPDTALMMTLPPGDWEEVAIEEPPQT